MAISEMIPSVTVKSLTSKRSSFSAATNPWVREGFALFRKMSRRGSVYAFSLSTL